MSLAMAAKQCHFDACQGVELPARGNPDLQTEKMCDIESNEQRLHNIPICQDFGPHNNKELLTAVAVVGATIIFANTRTIAEGSC